MSVTSDHAPEPLVLSMVHAVSDQTRVTRDAGEPAPLAGGAALTSDDGLSADRPLAFDTASPDDLARAGIAALRDALAAGNDRSAAFDLLTADALITEACAAAATGELPVSLAPVHFVVLLEEAR